MTQIYTKYSDNDFIESLTVGTSLDPHLALSGSGTALVVTGTEVNFHILCYYHAVKVCKTFHITTLQMDNNTPFLNNRTNHMDGC